MPRKLKEDALCPECSRPLLGFADTWHTHALATAEFHHLDQTQCVVTLPEQALFHWRSANTEQPAD